MTDRARRQLQGLQAVARESQALVFETPMADFETTMADLSHAGLDSAEVGWCLRHLFGLPLAEAVHRATVYQASRSIVLPGDSS